MIIYLELLALNSFSRLPKVYITSDEEVKDMSIPNLEEGDVLKVKEIIPKQNFTQPPANTEASLIKTLEELGIGRPSTYAPTITTILARNYVSLENKYFYQLI